MSDELNFPQEDLVAKEVPVWLGGKAYVLCEGSHDAVRCYRNAMAKASRMVDGKLSGFDGIADAEPLVVSMCLFQRNEDGTRGPAIPYRNLLALPDRIPGRLFEKLKEMTPGLSLKGETKEDLLKQREVIDRAIARLDEVKNSQSATTASSV